MNRWDRDVFKPSGNPDEPWPDAAYAKPQPELVARVRTAITWLGPRGGDSFGAVHRQLRGEPEAPPLTSKELFELYRLLTDLELAFRVRVGGQAIGGNKSARPVLAQWATIAAEVWTAYPGAGRRSAIARGLTFDRLCTERGIERANKRQRRHALAKCLSDKQ